MCPGMRGRRVCHGSCIVSSFLSITSVCLRNVAMASPGWFFSRVFEIEVEGKRIVKTQRRISAAFLSDVADLAKEGGLNGARVWAEWRGQRLVLEVSHVSTEGHAQRLRNAF